MIGLIYKDLCNLKKYIFHLLLILFLLSVFFIVSGDLSLEFISGYMVMMSLMVLMSAVSYDDHYRWDRFARLTPVSYAVQAGSKYLLGILCAAAGLVLALIITGAGCVVTKQPFPQGEAVAIAAVLAVGLLILSVLLPLLFKYGTEKARILLIGVALLPALALALFTRLFPSLPLFNDSSAEIFVRLLPLIALAVYFVSFLVSVRVLKNKEY